jgi:hypothetical protein
VPSIVQRALHQSLLLSMSVVMPCMLEIVVHQHGTRDAIGMTVVEWKTCC